MSAFAELFCPKNPSGHCHCDHQTHVGTVCCYCGREWQIPAHGPHAPEKNEKAWAEVREIIKRRPQPPIEMRDTTPSEEMRHPTPSPVQQVIQSNRVEFPQEIAERLVQAVIREAREIARERAEQKT